MRNTFSQALKIVFNAETILPFLFGSVCLAVFGNVIYDILKNIIGEDTPDLVGIAIIALVILAIAVLTVSGVITRRIANLSDDVPFDVQQKALERKYPGLILLVSNPEACEMAIRFHLPTLKRCWLICSTQTLEKANNLYRRFPKVCLDSPIVVNDIYDPLAFRACVQTIYRQRLPKGWHESEVIADYTGMTVHASVGTVLACLGGDRPLQYTPARFDDEGRAIGSMNPIRVWLRREVAKT